MGKHGCGNIEDNGERLVDLCLNNNCVVGAPFSHTRTPTANVEVPGQENRQPDRPRSCQCQVETVSEGCAFVSLCCRQTQKPERRNTMRLDIHRLKAPDRSVKKDFVLELRNRFRVLENTGPR